MDEEGKALSREERVRRARHPVDPPSPCAKCGRPHGGVAPCQCPIELSKRHLDAIREGWRRERDGHWLAARLSDIGRLLDHIAVLESSLQELRTAAQTVTDEFVAEMRERRELGRAIAELITLRNIVLRLVPDAASVPDSLHPQRRPT